MIQVEQVGIKKGNSWVLKNISFVLDKGRALCLAGPSGSGKTSLLEAMAGRLFYSGKIFLPPGERIAFVPQQHQFKSISGTQSFYYQQRFNSIDTEDALTVADLLPEIFTSQNERQDHPSFMAAKFHLDEIKDRKLIQLSNGESKRLQLVQALSVRPGLLLLDNPFLGLDHGTRVLIEDCLSQLLKDGLVIIISCSIKRMPAFVNQVYVLEGGAGKMLDAEHELNYENLSCIQNLDGSLVSNLFNSGRQLDFKFAVQMNNVQILYKNKHILKGINWQVRKGERWWVSGPNGSGKSTLLSLITADNPQAYANKIYLFDKQRGKGESIWDIKKNIGFLSPELHLYFDRQVTVFETIASGFFDTIGLFRALSATQDKIVLQWLNLLQLDDISRCLLRQLPLGKQRLVLFARALIKQPSLLVLDEPYQGLDEAQVAFFKMLIDKLCSRSDQTLIFVSHDPEDLPNCITHSFKLVRGCSVAL